MEDSRDYLTKTKQKRYNSFHNPYQQQAQSQQIITQRQGVFHSKQQSDISIGQNDNTIKSPFFLTDRKLFNKQTIYPIDNKNKWNKHKQQKIDVQLNYEFPVHNEIDFVYEHSLGFKGRNNIDLFKHYYRLYQKNKEKFKKIKKDRKWLKEQIQKVQEYEDEEFQKRKDKVKVLKTIENQQIQNGRKQKNAIPLKVKEFIIDKNLSDMQLYLDVISLFHNIKAEQIKQQFSPPKQSLLQNLFHKQQEIMSRLNVVDLKPDINQNVINSNSSQSTQYIIEEIFISQIMKSIAENGIQALDSQDMKDFQEIVNNRRQRLLEMKEQIELEKLVQIKKNIQKYMQEKREQEKVQINFIQQIPNNFNESEISAMENWAQVDSNMQSILQAQQSQISKVPSQGDIYEQTQIDLQNSNSQKEFLASLKLPAFQSNNQSVITTQNTTDRQNLANTDAQKQQEFVNRMWSNTRQERQKQQKLTKDQFLGAIEKIKSPKIQYSRIQKFNSESQALKQEPELQDEDQKEQPQQESHDYSNISEYNTELQNFGENSSQIQQQQQPPFQLNSILDDQLYEKEANQIKQQKINVNDVTVNKLLNAFKSLQQISQSNLVNESTKALQDQKSSDQFKDEDLTDNKTSSQIVSEKQIFELLIEQSIQLGVHDQLQSLLQNVAQGTQSQTEGEQQASKNINQSDISQIQKLEELISHLQSNISVEAINKKIDENLDKDKAEKLNQVSSKAVLSESLQQSFMKDKKLDNQFGEINRLPQLPGLQQQNENENYNQQGQLSLGLAAAVHETNKHQQKNEAMEQFIQQFLDQNQEQNSPLHAGAKNTPSRATRNRASFGFESQNATGMNNTKTEKQSKFSTAAQKSQYSSSNKSNPTYKVRFQDQMDSKKQQGQHQNNLQHQQAQQQKPDLVKHKNGNKQIQLQQEDQKASNDIKNNNQQQNNIVENQILSPTSLQQQSIQISQQNNSLAELDNLNNELAAQIQNSNAKNAVQQGNNNQQQQDQKIEFPQIGQSFPADRLEDQKQGLRRELMLELMGPQYAKEIMESFYTKEQEAQIKEQLRLKKIEEQKLIKVNIQKMKIEKQIHEEIDPEILFMQEVLQDHQKGNKKLFQKIEYQSKANKKKGINAGTMRKSKDVNENSIEMPNFFNNQSLLKDYDQTMSEDFNIGANAILETKKDELENEIIPEEKRDQKVKKQGKKNKNTKKEEGKEQNKEGDVQAVQLEKKSLEKSKPGQIGDQTKGIQQESQDPSNENIKQNGSSSHFNKTKIKKINSNSSNNDQQLGENLGSSMNHNSSIKNTSGDINQMENNLSDQGSNRSNEYEIKISNALNNENKVKSKKTNKGQLSPTKSSKNVTKNLDQNQVQQTLEGQLLTEENQKFGKSQLLLPSQQENNQQQQQSSTYIDLQNKGSSNLLNTPSSKKDNMEVTPSSFKKKPNQDVQFLETPSNKKESQRDKSTSKSKFNKFSGGGTENQENVQNEQDPYKLPNKNNQVSPSLTKIQISNRDNDNDSDDFEMKGAGTTKNSEGKQTRKNKTKKKKGQYQDDDQKQADDTLQIESKKKKKDAQRQDASRGGGGTGIVEQTETLEEENLNQDQKKSSEQKKKKSGKNGKDETVNDQATNQAAKLDLKNDTEFQDFKTNFKNEIDNLQRQNLNLNELKNNIEKLIGILGSNLDEETKYNIFIYQQRKEQIKQLLIQLEENQQNSVMKDHEPFIKNMMDQRALQHSNNNDKTLKFSQHIYIPENKRFSLMDDLGSDMDQFEAAQKAMNYSHLNQDILSILERIKIFQSDTQFLSRLRTKLKQADDKMLQMGIEHSDKLRDQQHKEGDLSSDEVLSNSGKNGVYDQEEEQEDRLMMGSSKIYQFWLNKLKEIKKSKQDLFDHFINQCSGVKSQTSILQALKYESLKKDNKIKKQRQKVWTVQKFPNIFQKHRSVSTIHTDVYLLSKVI